MTEDFASLRQGLAESVSADAGPLVAGALRSVPRHLFLPGVAPALAYRDEAIVTKRDPAGRPLSSSSQPALMAAMLAQLDLAPGQRVLEIGAGTGYNAALIRHIVGPSGLVVSIDIDQDLVEAARRQLAAAGYHDVVVLCRDGADGAAEYAPFDRLIVTVGVSDLSPAWPAQLGPAAAMVVPVEVGGPMLCVAFERDHEHWASRSVQPCGFIRVRGALAGAACDVPLTEQLTLHLPGPRDIDAAGLARALRAPAAVTAPTDVAAMAPAVLWGLYPWLSGSEPRTCQLTEHEPAGLLPLPPLRSAQLSGSYGLVSGGSIALLTAPDDTRLAVAGYGTDGVSLAAALAAQVRAWDQAGRPATQGLHVDAYPAGSSVPARPGSVIDRPWTRFAVYRA